MIKNKIKLLIYSIVLGFSLILLPGCGNSQSVEKVFEYYAAKKGFELKKSGSDLHLGFTENQEFSAYLNGVKTFYTLTFYANNGKKRDLRNFEMRLDRIIQSPDFHLMIEIKGIGNISAYTRRNKADDLTGFLFEKKNDLTSTYFWPPSKPENKSDGKK